MRREPRPFVIYDVGFSSLSPFMARVDRVAKKDFLVWYNF